MDSICAPALRTPPPGRPAPAPGPALAAAGDDHRSGESPVHGAGGSAAFTEALDEVASAGLDPLDARDAIGLIQSVEALGRRIDAIRVQVLDAIDRAGVHRADGHRTGRGSSDVHD